MSIRKLRKICEKIEEKEEPKNKIFYSVSMHGKETDKTYIIPEGVRIVMFCYSGRILDICPKFDLFNWENIFLDEDATYNWCTFLASLSQYPSLKDHFCIYNSGSKIKDINFGIDLYFRDGVFKLPIMGSVYDSESDRTYISTEKIFSKVALKGAKKIIVDRHETAKRIRNKENSSEIYSYYDTFRGGYNLKTLIDVLKVYNSGFTLLLLTCREGEEHTDISQGKYVYEELQDLYIRV